MSLLPTDIAGKTGGSTMEGYILMLNQSNLAELQAELREASAFITPLRNEINRIIAGQ